MKNLLLTSSGKFITKYNVKEFGKPLKDMRMAYITTAGNKVDDREYVERPSFAKATAWRGIRYE